MTHDTPGCAPPDDAASYLATIERFWLLLRRRGLMVSAEDVRQIELWREAGVPARIVCRALVEGAERYRQVHGDEDRLPGTLRYFRDAVRDAARRWRDQASIRPHQPTTPLREGPTPAAADEAAPATADEAALAAADEAALTALQAPVVDAGHREPDPRVRDAYRDAWRRLEGLRREAADGHRAADRLDALVAVDHAIIDGVLARLPEAERAALEAIAEAALIAEIDRLGSRGRVERRRALLEDAVTRRFDLVRLVPGPPSGPTASGMGWWRRGAGATHSALDDDDSAEGGDLR